MFVPVTDQERALKFYVDALDFEKRADFVYGGASLDRGSPTRAGQYHRLVPPGEGKSVGGDETCCAFATTDIEADHAALRARGVDVDPEVARAGTSRSALVSLDA